MLQTTKGPLSKRSLINSESLKKTRKEFDESGLRLMDLDLPKDKNVIAFLSLLFNWLLKNYCRSIELDPDNWKVLYNEILNKLASSQGSGKVLHSFLVRPTSVLEQRFNSYFRKFILQIQTKMHQPASFPLPAPAEPQLSHHLLDISELCGSSLIQTGRYAQDFIQERHIGSGGFGHVFKAFQKMDRCEYAIKKVSVQNCPKRLRHALSQALIEVQALAKLTHPNVVSFKSAWIETQIRLASTAMIKGSSSQHHQEVTSTKSFMLEEGSSSSDDLTSATTAYHIPAAGTPSTSSSSFIVFEGDSIAADSGQVPGEESRSITREVSTGGGDHHLFPALPQSTASSWKDSTQNSFEASPFFELEEVCPLLYIQMELCSKNLRSWLDERNKTCKPISVNVAEVSRIFRQVLEGVNYIHSKGILHRDLKPQNILFSASTAGQVKIGDFGLARLEQTSGHFTLQRHHPCTQAIGTVPYCAPEQLTHTSYDSKVDMYSLGVILVELLHPFSTAMERARALNEPVKFVTRELLPRLPALSRVILRMLSHSSAERPSCSDLLSDPALQNPDNKPEMASLKEENLRLRNLLLEKDELIEKLLEENRILRQNQPS